MTDKFSHEYLDLEKEGEVVYTALSKKKYYFHNHVTKFVLENEKVPISPFGNFDYFLTDIQNREDIQRANNVLIKISDELWVFGPISDGVLAEIKLAKKQDIPVKYFKIINSKEIEEVSKEEIGFEEDLEKHRNEL